MEQQEAKRRGLDELRDLRKEVDVLRAEMTVMRQAMEAALVRWDTVQAPDYSQEFGMVYQSIDQLEAQLTVVADSRLVAKPEEIAREINQASTRKVSDQVTALKEAVFSIDRVTQELSERVQSARTRDSQKMTSLIAFSVGAIFMMVLIVYVLPALDRLF